MYENISIQNQYQNTNISELLNGIVETRKKHIGRALELFNQSIDLRTASGLALDMWGRLLNFSRFIPVDESSIEHFRNFNFYNKNFVLLKFFNRADIVYAELSDQAYRQVLTLLWQSRNIKANVWNAGELAEVVFDSSINIGDSMDMQYIVYYFRDEIPAWLKYILENFDILPRPACVGSQAVSALARIFHFQTDDIDYNKKITAFYNAIFKHGTFNSGQAFNGFEHLNNKTWRDERAPRLPALGETLSFKTDESDFNIKIGAYNNFNFIKSRVGNAFTFFDNFTQQMIHKNQNEFSIPAQSENAQDENVENPQTEATETIETQGNATQDFVVNAIDVDTSDSENENNAPTNALESRESSELSDDTS